MKKYCLILAIIFIWWIGNIPPADARSDHIKGRIFLQVEDQGQAWYIDPVSGGRVNLGRPSDALAAMRKLGLGVNGSDLGKIVDNPSAHGKQLWQRLKGRILLAVESLGEAWYVLAGRPGRVSLGTPEDALRAMSTLGIGIATEDLISIPVRPLDYELAEITRVVDGDTVEALINGAKERIRLIGINTPETVDPRRKVECFGKEASAKARALLAGKNVKLVKDGTQDERDKYGRLLRHIFLADGKNFGLEMIRQGYAYEYTYRVPYAYQDEYKTAERLARDDGAGLWAANACPEG